MIKYRDPFAVKIAGGDIVDRDLPGFSDRRYEGTGIPAIEMHSLRRAIHPLVTKLAILFLIFGGCIFFTRLWWLQVVAGDRYRNIAEGNRIRLESIPAQRGLILDSFGKPLAINVPNQALVLVPADAPQTEDERRSIIDQITRLVDLSPETLSTINWQSYIPTILAEHLTHDQTVRLVVISNYSPGFRVQTLNERQYEFTNSAAHLLGYMGAVSPEDLNSADLNYQYQDYKGVAGVEIMYEQQLRGKAGKREIEVNNLGQPQQVYASEEPIAGNNLTLTVDAELQNILVESMERTLKVNNKTKGAAVALNPQTGAVLALASFPTFNPKVFSSGGDDEELTSTLSSSDQPLFNRVYSGTYPAGSTIKPVVGLAALADGIITPNYTINSVGGIWAGNRWFADWKAGGHGLTNISKAVAESVNSFFYIIGGGTENKEGLGPVRLAHWLGLFGFGQKTNINFLGEEPGLVPTPDWKSENIGERWFLGDTYNLSIGQGNLLVTPLQLASAYSALINGGNIWKPYYVKVINSLTNESQTVEPQLLKTLPISGQGLDIIKRAMRETVLTGSARSLVAVPVASGGKTGTAQAPGGDPHAWFAGFLPYENPTVILVVLIENGVEGSVAAVPVAREVFTWYAQNRL